MCVVSNVFDHYQERWRPPPYVQPTTQPVPKVWPWGEQSPPPTPTVPTKEEVEEFYRLMEKARQWDEEHDEPDCESDTKKEALQELADFWGIEIEFPE